jgi:hypothetical protein
MTVNLRLSLRMIRDSSPTPTEELFSNIFDFVVDDFLRLLFEKLLPALRTAPGSRLLTLDTIQFIAKHFCVAGAFVARTAVMRPAKAR